MKLNIKASELTNIILNDTNRIIINQGGTSAGKTYNTLIALIIKAHLEQNKLFSIVSESLPHLKRGAMKDFFTILKDLEIYNVNNHNRTDHKYTIGTCMFEFFGADSEDKLRGARRDYLFINECNNVSLDAFDQLEVRTKEQIYLDFNPVSYFWAHKMEGTEGVSFYRTTYLDNPFLDDNIIKSIERRRLTNPSWWKVYGLGEVGTLDGVIFDSFNQVEAMPKEYKWSAYGLDWGFTNDPTALVNVMLAHGELWLDELIYETGLTNLDIVNRMKPIVDRRDEIIADSAEPKSIQEIRRMGFNIKPTRKGKDSILNGIDIMKRYTINITANSVNLIKEFRNYQWQKTKDGEFINKPTDTYNHGIDSCRYVCLMKIGDKKSIRATNI